MYVLITGSNGQLGHDMVQLLISNGHDVIGTTRKEMDITDSEQCTEIIERFQPECIIHCAAYTMVDEAENSEDIVYQVNTIGTRNLAVAAEKINAKFVYISTDYVFDGESKTPYREYDNTNPINIYGKSKRAGEILVQSLNSKFFIIRTSWLYGNFGRNFVKSIIRLIQEKKEVKVVNDQIGSPTYTKDLVNFVSVLIESEKYGIYHASNTGRCTWFEFAKAIQEEAEELLEIRAIANLVPCTSEEYLQRALRPRNSVLEHVAIRTNGFQDFRTWREGLRSYLKHLNKGE